MPLNLNFSGIKFTLSNNTLSRMKLSYDKTKVKERGFMLCGIPDDIEPGPEHIGGKNGMKIRDCFDVKKQMTIGGQQGYFHTHPGTATSNASNYDAISLMHMSIQRTRPVLYCQAGNSDKIIGCQTVLKIPTYSEYEQFRKEAKPLRLIPDNLKPYLSEPYTFYAADIPAIINPVPVAPVPGPIVAKSRAPLFPHIPGRRPVLFPHITT